MGRACAGSVFGRLMDRAFLVAQCICGRSGMYDCWADEKELGFRCSLVVALRVTFVRTAETRARSDCMWVGMLGLVI